MLLGLARILTFKYELLYGEANERNANVVLAAAILITGVALASAYRRQDAPNENSSNYGSSVLLVGGALAAAVAAVGVVQLVLPATPYVAAAPACPGVPVVGARFLAQTQVGGVNARSGPGTDFPQVNRFPGSCTLGFDGYCIGMPIADKKTDSLDTRWLLVHDRDYLISSAKLLDQAALSDLGSKPHSRCEDLGGTAQPGTPDFTATITSTVAAALTVESANATLIGYAVRVFAPIDGYEYSAISVNSRSDGFDGEWAASSAAAVLPNGTGRAELAAASCLAVDDPSGDPAVYLASFERGKLVELAPTPPESEDDGRRLATAACSGPP
ncbi:hypothetical protein ACFP8W_14140 [Nocardioides hankookensis]